jgi:hypothetical protein
MQISGHPASTLLKSPPPRPKGGRAWGDQLLALKMTTMTMRTMKMTMTMMMMGMERENPC